MPFSSDRIQNFEALKANREKFDSIRRKQASCQHSASKITDGNAIRCGGCGKICGFVRDPKKVARS